MPDNFSRNALAMDQMVGGTMPQASQLINADVATQNMLLNKQRQAQELQTQQEAVKAYNTTTDNPVQSYAQLQGRQAVAQDFIAQTKPVIAALVKNKDVKGLQVLAGKYEQVGNQLGVPGISALAGWMKNAKFSGDDITYPVNLSDPHERQMIQAAAKKQGIDVDVAEGGYATAVYKPGPDGQMVLDHLEDYKQPKAAGAEKPLGGNTVNAEVWRDKARDYINQGMSEHEAKAKARVDMLEENREGSATSERVRTQQAGTETAPLKAKAVRAESLLGQAETVEGKFKGGIGFVRAVLDEYKQENPKAAKSRIVAIGDDLYNRILGNPTWVTLQNSLAEAQNDVVRLSTGQTGSGGLAKHANELFAKLTPKMTISALEESLNQLDEATDAFMQGNRDAAKRINEEYTQAYEAALDKYKAKGGGAKSTAAHDGYSEEGDISGLSATQKEILQRASLAKNMVAPKIGTPFPQGDRQLVDAFLKQANNDPVLAKKMAQLAGWRME